MTLSVEQAFPVRTREELIAWFQEHRWAQHQAMTSSRISRPADHAATSCS